MRRMSNEPGNKNGAATIWPWALAVGALAGFLIGREMGPRSGGGSAERTDKVAEVAKAGGAALPATVFKTEADFPAGWMKSSELEGVGGITFAGVKDAQKTAAMQALNERDCECGCGMGHIAGCAKKDPNCPRSPRIAKQVVEMAKQGKSLGEMLAYVD